MAVKPGWLTRHRIEQLARVLRALRTDDVAVAAAVVGDGPAAAVHVSVDTEPAARVLLALADADHAFEPLYRDDLDRSQAALHCGGVGFVVSWAHRCPHCEAPLPQDGQCPCNVAQAERRGSVA